MKDLTVIFITANEIPQGWSDFQLTHLLESADGYPLITVSRKEMQGVGLNLIDSDKKCYSNIYRQLLRAAKEADTEYVAMAEDDTLYCKEHFDFFRPKSNEVAYNMNKWSLFTWSPIYSLKRRKTNAGLIAPRLYLIEALEERFSLFPEGMPEALSGEIGRHQIEDSLRVTRRNAVEVYSEIPIIQISHPNGTEERQRTRKKALGASKAYDIPYWGKAEDIIKKYK